MKVNTMLNFVPEGADKLIKLLLALEYKPSEKSVRLITLF
jgi:hypothetical protein